MVIGKREFLFLAKFYLIFLAAEFLILRLDFSLLENFIASTQGAFLSLPSSENLVFVKDGTFEISPSCTGLVSSSILAAVIFSLKKPVLRDKIIIFAAGFALLLVLNYFRVLLVLWSGKEFGSNAAELVHIATWFSTSAFIILLWYYFTKRITGVKDFSGFL